MNWNPRKYANLEQKKRFLIVCEGEKTEPNYFIKFPANPVVHPGGKSTKSLVDDALKISCKDEFDEIWVVFDKDDFPDVHFNAAVEKAEANGIKVACSNPSFELWYLLHYIPLESALDRHQVVVKLEEHLGKYKKNDIDMYDKLLEHQEVAIKNAKRLMKMNNLTSLAKAVPYTSVCELVCSLNDASL